MENVQKHLSLLGLKVRERVTGITGVVASVNFDLYGCIQATVNRGLDREGKPYEQNWYDINRLEVIDNIPVMEQPDFVVGRQAEGRQGCAERPFNIKP